VLLSEPSGTYDKAIATRVIINLGEWAWQQIGLGWRRLNEFREWRLEEIGMPPFNQYLGEDLVADALSPHVELVELVNFASTYYVGTRVLKPLLSQARGGSVDGSPNCRPGATTARKTLRVSQKITDRVRAGTIGWLRQSRPARVRKGCCKKAAVPACR
jgi:hypothetical protein